MASHMLPISPIEVDILRILSSRPGGFRRNELEVLLHTRSEAMTNKTGYNTALWAMEILDLIDLSGSNTNSPIRITEEGSRTLAKLRPQKQGGSS